MKDEEVLIARITIEVDVMKCTDPGNAWLGEMPEEYVCVRRAEAVKVVGSGPLGILSVLDEGYFEHPDPDGLLVSAVREGLEEIAPPMYDQPEEQEPPEGYLFIK